MLSPNGQLSKRKTVQIMIALTILAWATQTLLAQWGFGAPQGFGTPTMQTQPSVLAAEPEERFLPAAAAPAGTTLEMRAEATIVGAEIKLKQVCRWSDHDAPAFAPLADLVVARILPGKPFKSISVNEIKSVLKDANVNLGGINFVGTLSCTINQSDAHYDERQSMQQWIDARTVDKAEPAAASTAAASTAGVADVLPATPAANPKPPATAPMIQTGGVRTLRDLLTADVAERLAIPVDQLQMNYKPLDDKVLSLSEPLFKFQIEPQRVRNLGHVEWDVTVISESGNRKMTIEATARAWQNQVVLIKPVSTRQVLMDGDVAEKRTLIETLPDDQVVTKTQAVGQQAARELKIGMVLTSRMLDAVELVKSGQFVTVTVSHGGVSIKTVARAMEGGTLGQTIKVKNEMTKDIYDVVLTGPQSATLNADAPPGGIASTN